jgi:16S rRNA U1498 N3-methylase RsmE
LNLLLFSDADRLDAADANIVTVCDRRLQHLRQVHRACVGDTLRVG